MLLRTSDHGRLDPGDKVSHLAWRNLLAGGRCVTQFGGFVRLAEVSFSYSGFDNDAVSRGASVFGSTGAQGRESGASHHHDRQPCRCTPATTSPASSPTST